MEGINSIHNGEYLLHYTFSATPGVPDHPTGVKAFEDRESAEGFAEGNGATGFILYDNPEREGFEFLAFVGNFIPDAQCRANIEGLTGEKQAANWLHAVD